METNSFKNPKLIQHIASAFKTNQDVTNILQQTNKEHLKAKTMHNFSKLCYKVLKQAEN